jgi:hypothetical protein
MKIFIPTYGRSDRQVTFDGLPKALQASAVLVVQRSEAKLYDDKYPLLVCTPSVTSIATKRQWIVDYARKASHQHIVMLDDDLRWAERRTDEPDKFAASDAKSITRLFATLAKQLKSSAHAGVSAREAAHTNPDPLRFSTRMTRVLGYDVEVLGREKIRFDRLPVQEDFDVTLQLLRKGYANTVINGWVHNQDGSNARGGCSTFLTPEMQADTSRKLAELHHPFVKVVEKTTKTAWGGATRVDVVVQWKQAFLSHSRDAK